MVNGPVSTGLAFLKTILLKLALLLSCVLTGLSRNDVQQAGCDKSDAKNKFDFLIQFSVSSLFSACLQSVHLLQWQTNHKF